MILFLLSFSAAVANAQTNGLSDAEIQGRQLAQQLCDSRPDTNYEQTGVLNVREAKGLKSKTALHCEIIATAADWQSIYTTVETNSAGGTNGVCLKIIHAAGQPNRYEWSHYDSAGIASGMGTIAWSGTQWTHPLPGDFWAADLGLEFFHWPAQKVLKKEIKRSQGCTVLESTNPNPATNGYSRVVSWIDSESGGIVQAEAYDAKGKKLKEFEPKSFKKNKITGQWELQEIQIYNVQTDSRTRLDFDLKK